MTHNNSQTVNGTPAGEIDMEDAYIQPISQTQPDVYLGDRNVVAQIKQRITAMTQMPADAPDYVVWQFAQVCTAHELNPFTGDAYIIELGSRKNDATGKWEKQYAVHIGVKGLRKMARRQANYQIVSRRMDAKEVQQYRRENYEAPDVGYEVSIYRLDVARECKDAGIPYQPVTAVGFWRMKGRSKKDNATGKITWYPDNIPETWTPDQVAEKRAEVSALKKAFDIEIASADFGGRKAEIEVVEYSQRQLTDYERDHQMIVDRDIHYEEDGNVLFP